MLISGVSRFMQNPQETHLQAAKHILHYLRRYPNLGKSKYFEIDYHFIHHKMENSIIRIVYILSQEQPIDLLTKLLGRTKFEEYKRNSTFIILSLLALKSLQNNEDRRLLLNHQKT